MAENNMDKALVFMELPFSWGTGTGNKQTNEHVNQSILASEVSLEQNKTERNMLRGPGGWRGGQKGRTLWLN